CRPRNRLSDGARPLPTLLRKDRSSLKSPILWPVPPLRDWWSSKSSAWLRALWPPEWWRCPPNRRLPERGRFSPPGILPPSTSGKRSNTRQAAPRRRRPRHCLEQAKMFLLDRNQLAQGAVFEHTVGAREHDSQARPIFDCSTPFNDAGPFVPKHQRRFCIRILAKENCVIEGRDASSGHSHQNAPVREGG